MPNKILFEDDARSGIKQGIDIVANAVKVTLGYGGRTVIISDGEFPSRTTKDGVTVASNISLRDPVHNAGAKLIKEISSKTANDVGDGTTTVCVLLQSIVSDGLSMVGKGTSPVKLKLGMEKALRIINNMLNQISIPVNGSLEMLKQVATVSANNDAEIGALIGEIYEKLGVNGVVAIENSMDETTSVEITDGFQFICGWGSPYFINTPDNKCELKEPFVMVVEGKISKTSEITKIMNMVAQLKRPIIILAEDFDFNVLGTMIQNLNVLNSCAIKYNFMGDTKQELIWDLCAVTGATLITEKTGKKIENTTIDDLGSCQKAIIEKGETKLIKGNRNIAEMDKRIQDAKTKIANARHPSLKQRAEQRMAALEGGIAVCKVGGFTEIERDEKKDRVEDSIRATKAALEEGVVPGGGTALLRCLDAVVALKKLTFDQDEINGITLIENAIQKPAHNIIKNAEGKADYMVETILRETGNKGFNAKTGEIEDLVASGILDPKKVVRVCIENSISAASQVIASEALIISDEYFLTQKQ